ncbi:MAG TPA: LpxI family protein, partial [Terricaulis sp.]|nr:LpxI family protein [Terricaulis sp.]
AHAAKVAAATGALDIGQGVVVCEGLVLAVEAQEGTDLMLARVAALPERLRGTQQSRRGALVKRPKPIQERRIDLPTIGMRTLEGAARAGLAGIAVEAGGALVVRRAELIAAAPADVGESASGQ